MSDRPDQFETGHHWALALIFAGFAEIGQVVSERQNDELRTTETELFRVLCEPEGFLRIGGSGNAPENVSRDWPDNLPSKLVQLDNHAESTTDDTHRPNAEYVPTNEIHRRIVTGLSAGSRTRPRRQSE
ncbi:MAG TPA: hypothetical protein PK992_05055 [Planctomycetaceae bacterium]|nr:hypothetical protein [Planctomycetaceae bacterium]